MFIQLPDELQIKILGELPTLDLLKATMVCHKWKELVYDGSLWTTIDVSPFYKSIPIENILKIIKCSNRFLKTANFRGCIQLTGHGLRTLAEYCPNLQVLVIKDCRGLSAASIGFLLQKSQQLRILDVSGLDTIKTSTLTTIKPSLSKLEKLNMNWCRNITGPGLLSMISASNNLSHLKLNGCPQLDDDTMSSLGKLLPNLSHLCLAACSSLTDSGMLAFLKNSSQLTHLNLSSCARLSDATLRNLALYSPNVTHLELAGCVLMTDQGFIFLSPRLRTLVHLDLEDLQQITDVTVRSIATHQPDLKRLCLSSCNQLSDESISHLVLEGTTCHKLQHIELDNCNITDEALNSIADYLQRHHTKRLSQLTSTDSDISLFSSSSESLLSEQRWVNRKISVEVLDCSNITEIGVRQALAKASPMLTIKSFYSFQENEDNSLLDDENSLDNIHRFHQARGSSGAVNYAIGRRGQAAGQHINQAGNCIIL
ncbi:unnamed protein product [Mucor hiemalis]